eukprot:10659744-Alexandrium_andersonii.AAC.1
MLLTHPIFDADATQPLVSPDSSEYSVFSLSRLGLASRRACSGCRLPVRLSPDLRSIESVGRRVARFAAQGPALVLMVGKAVAMEHVKFKDYPAFASFLSIGAAGGYRAVLEEKGKMPDGDIAEQVCILIEQVVQKLWRAIPTKVLRGGSESEGRSGSRVAGCAFQSWLWFAFNVVGVRWVGVVDVSAVFACWLPRGARPLA